MCALPVRRTNVGYLFLSKTIFQVFVMKYFGLWSYYFICQPDHCSCRKSTSNWFNPVARSISLTANGIPRNIPTHGRKLYLCAKL